MAYIVWVVLFCRVWIKPTMTMIWMTCLSAEQMQKNQVPKWRTRREHWPFEVGFIDLCTGRFNWRWGLGSVGTKPYFLNQIFEMWRKEKQALIGFIESMDNEIMQFWNHLLPSLIFLNLNNEAFLMKYDLRRVREHIKHWEFSNLK